MVEDGRKAEGHLQIDIVKVKDCVSISVLGEITNDDRFLTCKSYLNIYGCAVCHVQKRDLSLRLANKSSKSSRTLFFNAPWGIS